MPPCYTSEASLGQEAGTRGEIPEPPQEAVYSSHGCKPVVDTEGRSGAPARAAAYPEEEASLAVQRDR